MSTICSSPQIIQQQQDNYYYYNLINTENEQIILDFRAPPPSPSGSSRRTSSVANDGFLSEFLENSFKVPDLILPNKIFPRQKNFKEIPVLNFQEFKNSHENEFIFRVRECFEEIGCFQVINHGISLELMKTVARRAGRVFRVSPEKKTVARRSTEVPFGFEESEQEEGIGEMSEEFVWGRNCGFKLKMEGILPIKYSKFSTKMEILARAIEKVAKDIILLLISDEDSSSLIGKNVHVNDSTCHIYKHPHDVTIDQCIRSLRYDVIRMMIRRRDYSHALSFHICDGSSEFQVYSKKGWTSFIPLENALVVTCGDQIQAWSNGRYKHVIGKSIYTSKTKDCVSMAFLLSLSRNNNTDGQELENARIISLRHQALIVIFLIIACQLLFHIYTIMKYS
ncbi:hypothetical protein RND81_14G156300 [Saponaria officinalis]|uniref:Uncharacterized protein n=1 Tax=Saponaria officinalis TaxID=3572 RepID=A0AAW1GWQ7_SAPOF